LEHLFASQAAEAETFSGDICGDLLIAEREAAEIAAI
jgi:hypothetical protein